MCLEPEMTTNEESEFLRGIGKRNLSVIRQLAAGMHLGNRVDSWYTKLDRANKDALANVAYTMRCVVENERKAAEVEAAVGILQHTSKEHQEAIAILNHTRQEHQEAIAQLIAYVNKVHGKQVVLNQEINLLPAEMGDTNHRLFQLAWITVALWAIAAITIFAYLITS